jgi:hypothetical protein
MSKQTNQFQRLVAEIHRDLGPGWKITESREFADSATGQMREVDVVAEADVKGISLVISVEVRDRGRPSDARWVEEMVQKHVHLPTDKLVLWSANGFYKPALAKAKALKVETVTPGSEKDAPWATIARGLIGGYVKVLDAKVDSVVDVKLLDGSVTRWNAPRDMVLTEIGIGRPVAVVSGIEDRILNGVDVRTILLDHAPTGSGSFFAHFIPPCSCEVTNAEGLTRALDRLFVGIATICEVAPATTKSALYNDTMTTLAEAQLSQNSLRMVITETSSGPTQVIAQRIDRDPKPKKQRSKTKRLASRRSK